MSKPFLGTGWSWPVALDEQGELALARFDDSVHQSVWIILGTAKGERVMRPDFGCGIYDLVFEPATASTFGRIAEAVREALLLLEPRIDVRDIQVEPAGRGEVLLIKIEYEVRATNNVFNLVYPFYLERGA